VKLLRNQGFVLVLAAFAIFLVGKNLLWPAIGPKFSRRTEAKTAAPATTPVPAAPAPAVAAASNPSASTPTAAWKSAAMSALGAIRNLVPGVDASVTPEANMNVQELSNSAPAWASTPQRDPFKMRGGINDKSAREQLTLTGILRQTESDLAVLNNKVLAAGDTILGFRIETIEGDRVWVSGSNGREMLEFKYSAPQPSQPQQPPIDAATPVAVAETRKGG
jgi:hypothetical protein